MNFKLYNTMKSTFLVILIMSACPICHAQLKLKINVSKADSTGIKFEPESFSNANKISFNSDNNEIELINTSSNSIRYSFKQKEGQFTDTTFLVKRNTSIKL